MALRNQPYLPLYVQDYLTDEKLNACSLASQGVYIKLMCILHKSEEYGTVLLKQKDKQNASNIINFACKLAKLLPFTESEIESALIDLVEEGVVTIDGDLLFQKRMVKDNELSNKRACAGSKGGNKRVKSTILLKQKDKQNTSKQSSKTQANTEYESESEYESNSLKERSFIPPTTQEVRAYCAERKNNIDAEGFVAHYTKQGWLLGNGLPMTEWKSSVMEWEKRDEKRREPAEQAAKSERRRKDQEEQAARMAEMGKESAPIDPTIEAKTKELMEKLKPPYEK